MGRRFSAATGKPPDTDNVPNDDKSHYDATSTKLDDNTGATPTMTTGADLPGRPRDILEPLPPGWVQGHGFTKGLHPSDDVFLDDEDQTASAHQQSACDKGQEATEGDRFAPTLGDDSPCDEDMNHYEPTSPVCSDNEDADPTAHEYNLGEDEEGDAPRACDNGDLNRVPEPAGEPTRLTAQQRARLHELLRTRDSEGRVPYGLDRCADDASMWAAYRQGNEGQLQSRAEEKACRWDLGQGRQQRMGSFATPGRYPWCTPFKRGTTPIKSAYSFAAAEKKSSFVVAEGDV